MTRTFAVGLVVAVDLAVATLGPVQAGQNDQLAASAGLTAAQANGMTVDQIFAVKTHRDGNYDH
jgi:hypothetical protein